MARIESVDSIRFIAIVAVIAIHTTPFFSEVYHNGFYYNLSVFINQIARFAVPFFFVIAGYFWGVKIRNGDNLFKVTNSIAVRILAIYLFWSVIYLLPYNLSAIYQYGMLGPIKFSYWNFLNAIQKYDNLLLQGTKVHLWFLTSLMFSIYISALFINKNAKFSLLIFSISLYVFGTLLKSYADTPIGITVNFNTRNGPFFSTLLFVSGYVISRFTPSKSWLLIGGLLFTFGSSIHFLEIYTLNKLFRTDLYQDYVFGTYLMGLGAAILSLSNHSLLRVRALSNFGPIVLGIYAIHFIFVDLFAPIDSIFDSALWEIIYIVVVLVLSIFSVRLMSRSRIFSRFVS